MTEIRFIFEIYEKKKSLFRSYSLSFLEKVGRLIKNKGLFRF